MSWEAEQWQDYTLDTDQQFAASLDVIVIAVDFWSRCSRILEDDLVTELVAGELGVAVAQIVGRTDIEKHARCGQCVDTYFRVPWARRLASDGRTAGARNGISDIVASMHITTIKAEKTHIIGQDLKTRTGGNWCGPRNST